MSKTANNNIAELIKDAVEAKNETIGVTGATYVTDKEFYFALEQNTLDRQSADLIKIEHKPDKETLEDFFYLSFGYESTNWRNIENISARVFEIAENSIIVDCLIDKETRTYQKRLFTRSKHNFSNCEFGQLFMIRVYERSGEYRIKIEDGKGIVNPSDFEIPGLLKNIRKSKIFTPLPKKKK